MKVIKYYTIETEEQTPIEFCKNKLVAIFKCLFNKKAKYVFEFEYIIDILEDSELVGCVFSK